MGVRQSRSQVARVTKFCTVAPNISLASGHLAGAENFLGSVQIFGKSVHLTPKPCRKIALQKVTVAQPISNFHVLYTTQSLLPEFIEISL